MKITIEIDNLTTPQALALEDLLATWQQLGCHGSSRWTAFFADGDGNFRPKVKIDGRQPQLCSLTDRQSRWRRMRDEKDDRRSIEMYMLDFDAIAWALREKGEPAA